MIVVVTRHIAALGFFCALLAGTPVGAATLTWDSLPILAGAQDGNGGWGSSTAGTNWWTGSSNSAWTNHSDIPVFGANSASNVAVSLTNSVTVGGIVYSN